jgi:hypothetical protein
MIFELYAADALSILISAKLKVKGQRAKEYTVNPES